MWSPFCRFGFCGHNCLAMRSALLFSGAVSFCKKKKKVSLSVQGELVDNLDTIITDSRLYSPIIRMGGRG